LDSLRKNPVGASLVLFAIALCFRLVDLFLLRLDEKLGEILLSKALGLALVLAYLWLLRLPVREIGLHSGSLGEALSISGFGVGFVLITAYAAQFAVLSAAGEHPRLLVTAIDPKTGMAGGVVFAGWLVFGNIVNSFMEEGLFRGLMLRQFMTRLPAWRANLAQAALFSAWHLVWPLKHLFMGGATLSGSLAEAAMLSSGTLVSGFVYGYLYYSTGSLWAPWLAHTLNNTAMNLIHIQGAIALDPAAVVMQVIAVVGLLPFMAVVKVLAGKMNLPRVGPWRG
jgi:membrane protease YdiL (CAAX protease family)